MSTTAPHPSALCRGHYYRWQRRGGPDIGAFIADPGPGPVGRTELTERADKPEKKKWVANLPAAADNGRPICRLSFCTLWTQGKSPLCHNHKFRWYAVGSPEIEEFVRRCEAAGDDSFDFRPLDGKRQLKLELQYALQCRHDERQVNTHSSALSSVIRLTAASEASSLLEWPMEQWSEHSAAMRRASHDQNGQLAFLRYAHEPEHEHEHLEDLACGSGWESEYLSRRAGPGRSAPPAPGALPSSTPRSRPRLPLSFSFRLH